MRIIGIDCGLDGALVFTSDGNIHSMVPMPTLKNTKGKREIDISSINNILSLEKCLYRNSIAIVEDPGPHAPSAAGLRSMTYSYGIVKSLLVANDIDLVSVSARTWQKEFFKKPVGMVGKFDTKVAALGVANDIYPNTSWIRTPRSKKAFDGFVDAALIAEYRRRSICVE